jgi:hypothetical protein
MPYRPCSARKHWQANVSGGHYLVAVVLYPCEGFFTTLGQNNWKYIVTFLLVSVFLLILRFNLHFVYEESFLKCRGLQYSSIKNAQQ